MNSFIIRDRTGGFQEFEVPAGISLSLMEFLKAAEYPILATCGGMALCATCHVQFLQGYDQLPPPANDELDMLDTLPDASANSRLSCQVRVNEQLAGTVVQLCGDEY